ncbi:MAG: Uma2 family endonuclease [Roseiflexaceae bacterium]
MNTPIDTDTPGTKLATVPLRMSYEEYLQWDEYEAGLAEWVDGEVLLHMPPLDQHQRAVEFLERLLDLFVQLFQLGIVRIAPFSMRVSPASNAREPDLFFLATEHLGRLNEQELSGPADLVVEVISDDTVYRDRETKFFEYQSGGVAEYWIIDLRPKRRRVDCYWLTPRGEYQASLADEDQRYHSVIMPGFWFRPAWLWEEPRPDPLSALAEMRGLSPEAAQALRRMLIGAETMHS